MQLVPSTPNSKPVPESIKDVLAAISQNDLREVVEGISVPRPPGRPKTTPYDGASLGCSRIPKPAATASRWTVQGTW